MGFSYISYLALKTGLSTGSESSTADVPQQGFSLSSDCHLNSFRRMASDKFG